MKYIVILTFAVFFMNMVVITASAQEAEVANQDVMRARVVEVLSESELESFGEKRPVQVVNVELLEGTNKGEQVRVNHGKELSITSEQKVSEGDAVVVSRITGQDGIDTYFIVDNYRLDSLIGIFIFFFILVISLSKWKGLGSIAGLGISLIVILTFIVPRIIAGDNPVVISILGSLFILLTTMYLAHGFSKKTTVAFVATFCALVLTAFLSWLFVELSRLSGLGSEDAYALRFGQIAFNYKGLLLGGMIIGALGVLDDITTGQSAAVFELYSANSKLGFSELVKRSLNIGREHISSLVNTLVLAYSGASLPIFLFFVLNPTKQPVWFILNSEFVAEEIVRTLSGSMGLVLAVPITSMLAAWVVTRKK